MFMFFDIKWLILTYFQSFADCKLNDPFSILLFVILSALKLIHLYNLKNHSYFVKKKTVGLLGGKVFIYIFNLA